MSNRIVIYNGNYNETLKPIIENPHSLTDFILSGFKFKLDECCKIFLDYNGSRPDDPIHEKMWDELKQLYEDTDVELGISLDGSYNTMFDNYRQCLFALDCFLQEFPYFTSINLHIDGEQIEIFDIEKFIHKLSEKYDYINITMSPIGQVTSSIDARSVTEENIYLYHELFFDNFSVEGLNKYSLSGYDRSRIVMVCDYNQDMDEVYSTTEKIHKENKRFGGVAMWEYNSMPNDWLKKVSDILYAEEEKEEEEKEEEGEEEKEEEEEEDDEEKEEEEKEEEEDDEKPILCPIM
jgi:hypothetical protein